MLTAITRAVSRSLASCELTWLQRQPIDIDIAIAQHHDYEQRLRDLGATVIALPALEEHPDAVFVEDPAIVLDDVAVILTMGCESRRGERDTLAEALAAYRPLIHMQDPARLEGGDVMCIGNHVFAGLSARTDAAGVAALSHALRPFGYQVIPVELRGCLHLKSGCCFIGEKTILINQNLIDTGPLRDYRFINVAPDEPGAANTLSVNDTVLIPSCFPATAQVLRKAGFKVHGIDVSELLKAESGVTCSSLLFNSA